MVVLGTRSASRSGVRSDQVSPLRSAAAPRARRRELKSPPSPSGLDMLVTHVQRARREDRPHVHSYTLSCGDVPPTSRTTGRRRRSSRGHAHHDDGKPGERGARFRLRGGRAVPAARGAGQDEYLRDHAVPRTRGEVRGGAAVRYEDVPAIQSRQPEREVAEWMSLPNPNDRVEELAQQVRGPRSRRADREVGGRSEAGRHAAGRRARHGAKRTARQGQGRDRAGSGVDGDLCPPDPKQRQAVDRGDGIDPTRPREDAAQSQSANAARVRQHRDLHRALRSGAAAAACREAAQRLQGKVPHPSRARPTHP